MCAYEEKHFTLTHSLTHAHTKTLAYANLPKIFFYFKKTNKQFKLFQYTFFKCLPNKNENQKINEKDEINAQFATFTAI